MLCPQCSKREHYKLRKREKEDSLLARWISSQKLGPLALYLRHLFLLMLSDIPHLLSEPVHRRVELLKAWRHSLNTSSHVHESRRHVGIEPFLPMVIRLAPGRTSCRLLLKMLGLRWRS